MTILPLLHKLKKKAHKDIALAQDILIIEIYNSFPDAVVHGGTAIWRCYGGNRFSEDIDVYLPKKLKKSEVIKAFLKNLKAGGFEIKKFREKENSIFSVFSYQNTVLRFEAVFENIRNYITKTFEMSDGTFTNVHTFKPEDLIKEKISAYISRKKIRDLYDIFFLLNFIQDKKEIKSPLKNLIKNFENPADIENLKVMIISGAIPSLKNMEGEIEKWAK